MKPIRLKSKRQTISLSSIIIDWQNRLTDTIITVKPHVVLDYYLIQGLGSKTQRTLEFKLEKGSTLNLYGLVLGQGNENINCDIFINHCQSSAQSNVSLKGVLTHSARAVLNGTIIIAPEAQLTNAYLEERVLLMSDEARAQTQPNLEIEADEVKAAHAAAVSQLSEDELFYLQARGLSTKDAKQLIISGFLQSILAKIQITKSLEKKVQHFIQQIA